MLWVQDVIPSTIQTCSYNVGLEPVRMENLSFESTPIIFLHRLAWSINKYEQNPDVYVH